jgi:hypothetical protein
MTLPYAGRSSSPIDYRAPSGRKVRVSIRLSGVQTAASYVRPRERDRLDAVADSGGTSRVTRSTSDGERPYGRSWYCTPVHTRHCRSSCRRRGHLRSTWPSTSAPISSTRSWEQSGGQGGHARRPRIRIHPRRTARLGIRVCIRSCIRGSRLTKARSRLSCGGRGSATLTRSWRHRPARLSARRRRARVRSSTRRSLRVAAQRDGVETAIAVARPRRRRVRTVLARELPGSVL